MLASRTARHATCFDCRPGECQADRTDDPQAPCGGFNYSGFGREYDRYGIDAFLEPRAIFE
jgi:acyl-CoA reductase-like NAD-dependent aldehyde dehydrogenase